MKNMNIRITSIWILLLLLLVSLTAHAKLLASISSPDGRYNLCVDVLKKDEDGNEEYKITIVDSKDKHIEFLGNATFPIVGMKWHNNSKSVLILTHASGGPLVSAIKCSGEEKWNQLSYDRLCEDYKFTFLSAVSSQDGFTCYCVVPGGKTTEPAAITVKIDVKSGGSKIVRMKDIEASDLPFYRTGIIGAVSSYENPDGTKGLLSNPTRDEKESPWYLPAE